MKLTTKLLLGAATLTIVPILLTSALVGGGAIQLSSAGLTQAAESQLVSLREVRRQQINDYFNTLVSSVQAFAVSNTVIEGYSELRQAFGTIPADPDVASTQRTDLKRFYETDFDAEFLRRNPVAATNSGRWVDGLNDQQVALQHAFIVSNANPLGAKDKLESAPTLPTYSAAHSRYHSAFSAFRAQLGFYDVFLIDTTTDKIIYSVFKETDFGTSLNDGVAAKSGLDQVYRKVKAAGAKAQATMSDYSTYRPSYDDQAAFVAVPVVEQGQLVGVLAVQLPIDKVTALMTANQQWKEQGLGESGETYLVGADKLMRTESRFLLENKTGFIASTGAVFTPEERATAEKKNTSIGLLKIDTAASNAALDGKSGFEVVRDYRDISVFSAYGPVNILGVRFGLLAELDESEALATANTLERQTLLRTSLTALGLLVLAGGLGLWLVRSITRPINELSGVVSQVALGNDEVRSTVSSGDEIQELGDTFNKLLDERIATLRKAEKENEMLNDSVVGLLQTVFELSNRNLTVRAQVTADVVGTVADSVNMLANATNQALTDVRSVASQVDDSSRKVTGTADALASQAQQDQQAVMLMSSDIAKATDLMRLVAGLAENSRQSAQLATGTTLAALKSVTTTVKEMSGIRESIAEMEKRIKRLGERSQEISQIVTVINSISERTHVLALNASMQAAMAGEAGRGFAVVTEEVQRLADTSRNATMQIAQLAQNIQLETTEAVAALNKTVSDVVQGSQVAQTSGEQMRETETATARLAESVQRIADESVQQLALAQQLANRATELATSSQKTSAVVASTVTDAQDLANASSRLVQVVSDFRLAQVA